MFAIGSAGGSFTLRFLGVPIAGLVVIAATAAWRRRRRLAAVAAAALLALATAWVVLYVGRPRWLELAIVDPAGAVAVATPAWTTRAPGLETAEVGVTLDGDEVDSIALVRLDQRQFALAVHWDGDHPASIEDWQAALGASVVINGSYFEPDFTPTTPVKSAGVALGPAHYVADHGALAIGDTTAILDLRGAAVPAALAPYHDAMVSYPLLVDGAGHTRARGHDDWFANRVFIGLDASSRIVIGTTRTGFFSLPRLGALLVDSPLDLRIALNLDGGPIASQIVDVGGWRRVVHGNAEITGSGDVLRMQYQAARARVGAAVKLPLVLAATRRN